MDVCPISSGSYYWIGLSDRHTEGIYLWNNDAVANYTAWNPGQPNDVHSKEDCVFISHETDYTWYDTECENNKRYICESDTGIYGKEISS